MWPLLAADLARVTVAELAQLPTYGVALAAVPDMRARPFATSPSPPGSCATGRGPAAAARATTKRGNSRAISATRAHDRQNRDIRCKCAAHVTNPLILNICVAARGDGTTASRVALDRNGLVPNRRAPKSGTAARVTTLFGSIPSRPRRHVRGPSEPVDTPDSPPPALRGPARAGDGAPTKPVLLRDRVPRRARSQVLRTAGAEYICPARTCRWWR